MKLTISFMFLLATISIIAFLLLQFSGDKSNAIGTESLNTIADTEPIGNSNVITESIASGTTSSVDPDSPQELNSASGSESTLVQNKFETEASIDMQKDDHTTDTSEKSSTNTSDEILALNTRLESMSSPEIAEMVFSGEIPYDLLDLLDLDLDVNDFIALQKREKIPLALVKGTTQNSVGNYEGFGVQVSLNSTDVLDMYMYDPKGRYTGPVKTIRDADGYQLLAEQIPGTQMSTFGGGFTYVITDDVDNATIFFEGKVASIGNIHMHTTNAEEIMRLSFPVSSSTRGTVTFNVEDGTFIVNKWNFDFDGDKLTDVSIGNHTNFTKDDYRLAFDLISNDTKLSAADREKMASFEEPYIASVFGEED